MIETVVTFVDRFEKLRVAAKRAELDNLKHAAADLRLKAIASIHQSDKPSEPGTPPHSKEGALPAAILFAVDAATLTAVVGPTRRKVGLAGKAHEFGGEFRGENYPARPFMAPAMLKTLDRFAGSFRGDIAE